MTEILKDYDHILYLPIAYNLSSQYKNSLILLNNPELSNKITIIKHYFTGIQLGNFILALLPLVQNISGIDSLNLDDLVKQWEKDSLVTVIPSDINLLAKRGRTNKIIIIFFKKDILKLLFYEVINQRK